MCILPLPAPKPVRWPCRCTVSSQPGTASGMQALELVHELRARTSKTLIKS